MQIDRNVAPKVRLGPEGAVEGCVRLSELSAFASARVLLMSRTAFCRVFLEWRFQREKDVEGLDQNVSRPADDEVDGLEREYQ